MRAEGDWLSFRMAGGYNPRQLRIELRSGGALVAAWTGFDADAFLEILYPLGDLRGQMFTLALVDEARGRWGHLMLDDIMQFDWGEGQPRACPSGTGPEPDTWLERRKP